MKLALATIVLAGCLPTLDARTPAPPGRSARLDTIDGFWQPEGYRLELSTGVAIGLTCDRGDPCEHMRVRSDDPAIADARLASLGVLEHPADNARTSAALVIIGKTPGATHIRVRADQGDRDIAVTVIPPPKIPAAN